jgi:tetratricopeptide (TPR) repeat protein
MKNLIFVGYGKAGLRLLLAGVTWLTVILFAPGQFPPAVAQTINGASVASEEVRGKIERGRTELQENNYAAASTILTTVIRDERTPPDWMAIAFFYRGIANRMTGQNSAAIADFINALWLDTLPEIIQSQAYFHRAHARAAMGDMDEALADLDEASRLAPDEQRIAEARNQMLELSGQEITGAIGQAGQGTPEEAVQNAISGIVTSQIFPGTIPTTRQPTPAAPARPVSLQSENDPPGIRIQLGALDTQETANAEWQRISRQHQDILGNLTPSFQTITREGKSMVRLQAGPAASLPAARNLCALLKGRGQDCIAISR